MNRSRRILFVGLLAGSLVVFGILKIADAKDGVESHGQHKGWDNPHSKKFDRSTHDRRNFGHNQQDFHRDSRWAYHRGEREHSGWNGRYDRHDFRRDARFDSRGHGKFDNRGHHNKPEIRQDFKDVRATRKGVQNNQKDVRKDYGELRRDRLELRRDIRNGASKEEIMKDRQEIRGDYKEIADSRKDLRQDQAKLDSARRELKSDLRKR